MQSSRLCHQICITLKLFIIICITCRHMYECGCVHATVFMQMSDIKLLKWVSLFALWIPVIFWVIRLGGKFLSLISHLGGPMVRVISVWESQEKKSGIYTFTCISNSSTWVSTLVWTARDRKGFFIRTFPVTSAWTAAFTGTQYKTQ